MKILAIHDGHGASVALAENSRIVAALQEERLTRLKNQGGFPTEALKETLRITGWNIKDFDQVVFSGRGSTSMHNREDILLNFARRFEPQKNIWKKFGKNIRQTRNTVFPYYREARRKSRLAKRQEKRMFHLLQQGFERDEIRFLEHHKCHAASAYFGQGNMQDEILVLTCDAAGDGICAAVWKGYRGQLEKLASVPLENSPTMLYGLMTYLLGFVPMEHEYKLMGMSPYAEEAKGSQEIKNYFHSLFRFGSCPLTWERVKGLPSVFKIAPLLQEKMKFKRFDHIAAGLQMFCEEFFLEWVQRVIKETGIKKLAAAGGLFMNVKLNQKILELPQVESFFPFPSCGDETNSFGAAWLTYAESCLAQNEIPEISPLESMYLGGDFKEDDIKKAIDNYSFRKQIRITLCDNIEKRCAELLAQGEVVARCKGRMEFGARALGNRSILADAQNWKTIHLINAMVKKRDFWMPFAPSMLAETADDYIVNPRKVLAPFMIMAFPGKKENIDKIIAATHPYDKTCRPQMVTKEANPDYHRLIEEYGKLTDTRAILNTSFNLHGFPIVYRPQEALYVFDNSGLNYLALGNFLIEEKSY